MSGETQWSWTGRSGQSDNCATRRGSAVEIGGNPHQSGKHDARRKGSDD